MKASMTTAVYKRTLEIKIYEMVVNRPRRPVPSVDEVTPKKLKRNWQTSKLTGNERRLETESQVNP
jgi:hypothetical protein